MNENILEILVCPICKGKLVYQKEAQELICKFDRIAYPIRNGIPIMLEQEGRVIPNE